MNIIDIRPIEVLIYFMLQRAYYLNNIKGVTVMDEHVREHQGGGNPPYNTQPAGLERWINETLNKKSPVQLPEGAKKWLADNSWWLAIVGVVLSLLGAWSAWQSVALTNQFLDNYGMGQVYRQALGSTVYVSIISALVSAVLLFMAQAKLKMHQKDGWNLLFYNFLITIALSVVSVVMNASYGLVSSIIGLAIGFVIGGWLLFQFRKFFTK